MTIPQLSTTETQSTDGTQSTGIQPPSDARLREMAKQIEIELGAIEGHIAANWLRSLHLSLETAATILEDRLPPRAWEEVEDA